MSAKIRKWALSDACDLAKAVSNPRVLNNLRDGLPYPYTEADAKEFITLMLQADPNTTFSFAIECEGKAVGSIAAFRQSNIHARTAELGYYVGEDDWGKGIATQAVLAICSYLFENTDILRIFAEPFAYNLASCRVLEKAGFECEGILRSNAFKNGKVLDMKMYALIKK